MIELEFKESQRIALEILKKVACICEEHNFRYVLIWGTLIGAIRHNGFIPWDDDIDIAMPRPDYDKLLSFFKKHRDELMPLECLTMETRKNYPHMIARISDSRTWMLTKRIVVWEYLLIFIRLTDWVKLMMRLLRQWNMLDLITLLYFLLPENIIIRGIQKV